MTAPLVPADCDLRGLDYMPLFGNHLFGSEFNAGASDSEWRAAITLWWAAWNQVPAGSLPDDDVALCRLADLGRDVKGWKRLRARALHGFIKCDDGRLYHEFLCKQALVAWDKRVKERERKARWRAEHEAKRAGQNADVPRDKTVTAASQDATVRADVNGRDVTGRDDVKNFDQPSAPDPAAPTAAGALSRALRERGVQSNPMDPRLLALAQAGCTPQQAAAAADEALAAKGPGARIPPAYVFAILERWRTQPSAMPTAAYDPVAAAQEAIRMMEKRDAEVRTA